MKHFLSVVFCFSLLLCMSIFIALDVVADDENSETTIESKNIDITDESGNISLPGPVLGNLQLSEGSCGDNVQWKFNTNNGILTIDGTGKMDDYYYRSDSPLGMMCYSPWSRYSSEIKKVVIKESVTSIGQGAFFECKFLTEVEIPIGIKTIGAGAFEYCSALRYIIIPEGVESIGNHAFYHCESLTSIQLPSTLKSVGYFAFDYCDKLVDVNYDHDSDDLKDIYSSRIKSRKEAEIDSKKSDSKMGFVIYISIALVFIVIVSSCIIVVWLRVSENKESKTKSSEAACSNDSAMKEKKIYSMYNGYISFLKGWYIYTSSNGYNSVISESMAVKKEESYQRYCAYMDIDRGSMPEDLAYQNRGFIKKDGGWVYKSSEILSKTKGKEKVKMVGTLDIPNTIGGLKINCICDEAFSGCNELDRVILPANIKIIGSRAFADCTKLKYIEMFDRVFIARDAFENTAVIKTEKMFFIDMMPMYWLM